jgi:OOP family OmpA-OmpF porin
MKRIILILIFFLLFILSANSQSYDFGKTKVFSSYNPAVAMNQDMKDYLNALITYLYANQNLNVRIVGHSDSTGTQEDNQKKSEERANAIVQYITSKGIEASRIFAGGKGSTQPAADNNTQEGRDKNNRVEINIIYDKIEDNNK